MGDVPILELRSISLLHGEYLVLNELSFAISEGETVFFMGAAGSGKSSVLKTAAGIDVASAGEVLYRGRDLADMSRREETEFRKRTGFVFQDAALWANQSLYDNLALPLRVHSPGIGAADLDKAVRKAAELVGYDEDLRVRPADLSQGERQLIGLARALILDPELLFMDEPATYLDEESADRVAAIQADLKARGRSLLVASSNSEAASRLADRIGVLRTGRLLAYGSLAEAAAWNDPAIRGITGRLRARGPAARPDWADGLAGAWADAMAADLEEPAADQGESPEPGEPGALPGAFADEEDNGEEKEGDT